MKQFSDLESKNEGFVLESAVLNFSTHSLQEPIFSLKGVVQGGIWRGKSIEWRGRTVVLFYSFLEKLGLSSSI